MSTKESEIQYLGAILTILIHFQGKPFNITVIQVYALTINAEEDEVEWVNEELQELQDLLELKMMFFSS